MEKDISKELTDIAKKVSESLMVAIYERRIVRLIEKEFGLDL